MSTVIVGQRAIQDIESTGQYDRVPSRIPGGIVGSTRLEVHTAW
jgi:hypothetical protein